MTTLSRRFRALPRSMRWLAWFLLVLVIYFLAVEPMVDRYAAARQLGDSKQAELERTEAAGDAVTRAGQTAILGVNRFGGVEYPGDPQARSLQFNKVVGDILQKHGVTGETSTTRTTPLSGSSALAKRASAANYRIDRLTKTLEFQADPDVVVAVIADLEQSPIISTISNVQIRQFEGRGAPPKSVSASITAETWVMTRKEARR